ncbi:MAG: helix-turn-helix domain-containing protein [bacterium]|nr:helix-turn-helix domain-containing protein [bacterium]MCM1373570.1 helix-turn-helix domain-containing protein [Muribaculum sp.]
MTMGDKIKYHREKLGLTQEELGAKLPSPVKKAAVMKWEKGNVENIKRSNILKMAELFEISPCELMFSDSKIIVAPEPEPVLTNEQNELVQIFTKLNADGQKAILKYAEYIATQPEYQKKKKELLNA